ncbi:MAG TPA: tRNA (adenine-N1)-methyltransferase [Thermoplasmata archaeon]|jgi:tRNA (adenine57-N1/adenine58-N1)-methyltransferase|nr:tRNA (adenine-N1)-methyltransferase [Thermoplasmata archaeon]
MGEPWSEGDPVALKRAGEAARLVRLARGPQTLGNEGVLDLTELIGMAPGTVVNWLGTEYRALRPSLSDLLASLHRGAQIITAKDAAHLLLMAGVSPGATVAEAGAGSGALTIVLAHAVGPTGRVVSYDRRDDFLDAARANVRRAGLERRVEFRRRDVVSEGIDANDLASIILDLPEPWVVLPSALQALTPGGYAATYTPTYNQLERTVRSFRELGFDEVRAVELLERGLHVGEGGTRPAFEMLGHTGFLAAGRRVA